MSGSEAIASAGVFLLFLAFAANLAGSLARTSRLYHVLNFVGAGLACYAAILIAFVPFIVLEGVWSIVALGALIRPRAFRESSEAP